ncbi:MAG: PQQ-dependent sugar dehydrogenase, partial [Bacteroidota bacterium]
MALFLRPHQKPIPISFTKAVEAPSSLTRKRSIPSRTSFELVPAFEGLNFVEPVQLLEIPGSQDWMVVCKPGQVWTFSSADPLGSQRVVLDISHEVQNTVDGGLMGVAFHPEVGGNTGQSKDFLYIYYYYSPENQAESGGGYRRLARFEWEASTQRAIPESEVLLIQQFDPQHWHSGGSLFFDELGFLYLSLGDAGAFTKGNAFTQQIDQGFFGGVIRIDVDQRAELGHPIRRQPISSPEKPAHWPESFTQGYFIPDDNPWQDEEGGYLEEFFAIGLRSPHRMTQDPVSGNIWVADIGEAQREEISLLPMGSNLQWPYREGEQ